jgi:ribose/xylose/arabinose/galactoside ABC-type transport system permease subunit
MLYMRVPMLPYVICGAISVAAGVLAMQRLGRKNPSPAVAEKNRAAD